MSEWLQKEALRIRQNLKRQVYVVKDNDGTLALYVNKGCVIFVAFLVVKIHGVSYPPFQRFEAFHGFKKF